MPSKIIRTSKLDDNNENVVIASDIHENGAKEYIGFKNILSAFKYINNSEIKNFHEVIRGDSNRKIYFDFDKELKKPEHSINTVSFVNDMTEVISTSIESIFGVSIDKDRIVFADSSVDRKSSYHIILPDYNLSLTNMTLLYSVVSKTLNQMNDDYNGCLDKNVYKQNQCFRMLGSCKMGKSNYKKLITQSFSKYDTLIGIYAGDESQELHTKDEIQKIIDEHKQKYESHKINTFTSTNDYDTMEIVMNLNQSRAHEYGDWLKVCLALGYEKAGLNVALEFAKRSSKFDPVKTEQVYNKGSNHTHGRPATIGSLLAMLKEDNPKKFYEILSLESGNNNFDFTDIVKQLHKAEEDEYENQEEKLSRWLKSPEYSFYHKVSNPRNVLIETDMKKIYNAKHMKPYSKTASTQIIKAEKGTGKTYALEEYIKAHNPEYCIFLSFRKSLSNEIINRLSKHGFVNYLDIKGPITAQHKRVIIQVESIPRLRWERKPDLLIGDEIESIRSQFFSETCRTRNACMSKYEMLLACSEQVIFMDADISENTIKHIRRSRSGKLHYIENTYKKVQSKFKEFYTTKLDKIFVPLCRSLDANEKIILPTNRSTNFMEALQAEIMKKYPNKKIQLFNSKTIRDPNIADEAKNTECWQQYDIVIYSPTISAGVSIEYEYFDKCFCYFVNNGKVNSMRQMINRVRKFKTNEFYYCLQAFGGSSKPKTVETMERYICSNRFVDQPDFIFAKENYDGTKSYPYKNTGYYLWIYNEIETARDKSMFIFNFLREQYHAGIGTMEWIPDRTEDPSDVYVTITEDGVKATKKQKDNEQYAEIANASPITEVEHSEIKTRLEKETEVSKDEINSFKRKNLLNFYNLAERDISGEFVKSYGSKSMKSAFKNRQALKLGLKSLCNTESNSFNDLFLDETSVQDDLKKKYIGRKLVIAKELLTICGFKGFYDNKTLERDVIERNIKKHKLLLVKK